MTATDVTIANIQFGHGHLKVDGTSVGALSGGLLISKATTVVDVMIDQLTAPAKEIPTKEDFTVKTTVSEMTLTNLQIIWNIPAGNLSGSTLKVGASTGVVEHTLDITGHVGKGATQNRGIHIFRAISVQASEHGFFRDKETVFPVVFTILPDTTQPVGQELASITDY